MIRLLFRIFLIFILGLNLICIAKEEVVTLKDDPYKDFNISDYNHFLQNIEKIDKEVHGTTKREDFIGKLYDNKIDVGIEINKYFTKETPIPVTLEDCIDLSMMNNFNIRILRTKESQRMWEYNNNRAEWLPTAYWNGSFYNLNGHFLAGGVIPVAVEESPFYTNFWLNWNILDGTNRIFSIKSKRTLYNAAKQDVKFTQEEVLKNTVTGYYSVLGYKLGIEVLTQNLLESQAQLDINKQNLEAGIGTKFDVLRAEAEVARAQQRLTESYNLYRQAQVNLANILGIDVAAAVFPVENDVNMKSLVDKNLEIGQISQMAFSTRPDVEALRLKVKSLEYQKITYYSGFLPNVSGFGALGNVGTNDLGIHALNKQVGVIATWPLGKNLGLYEYTTFKNFDAKICEAKLELEKRCRGIQENVIKSYYETRTSEERVKYAQDQVKSADESLRLAFLRLESGIGIYVDVLQSQSAKVDAKINLIRAIIDYNVAQANLLFEMGAISPQNILKNSAEEESKNQKELEDKSKKEKLPDKETLKKEMQKEDAIKDEIIRRGNLEEFKKKILNIEK